MIWKNALKYPALIMGIIMFVIFLSDPKTKDYWNKQKRRFIPSTCDAIIGRSGDKLDKSWKLECPGTKLLLITIPFEERDGDKFPETRQKIYKTLANSLLKISQVTNPEAMEQLLVLKIIVESERLKVLAQTDGEAVVGFKTKKNHKELAEHLKLTVKIKEFR